MAKKIPALLPAANGTDICHTCCKPAHAPFRQYDKNGRIVSGCVANFHTGHLVAISQSGWWHNRLEAKRIRTMTAKAFDR